jgi:hypothetical protein
MKNHIQFSFLFLFICFLSNAQQASRFPIKTSSEWRINYEYSCMDVAFSHVNGDEEYKYFVDGDTLIHAVSYYKLYKSGMLYLDSPFRIDHKYMGAIRDSADKYFYIDKQDESEILLYDFSLNLGDSVYIKDRDMKFPIDELDTLDDGRKQFVFYIISVNCGSANTIIEGIGWLGGLLEGNSCSGHPGVRGSYLVCYSEDGETKYESGHTRCGETLPCNNDFTAIKDPSTIERIEIGVLSDGNIKVMFHGFPLTTYNLEIFNILGSKIYQIRSDLNEPVDVSRLAKGTYVAKINNKDFSYSALFSIK